MALSHIHCPEEEFVIRLRERLPMNVCFTFTSEQIEALRRVFGDRFDGGHEVDMRGRIYLPWSRYYIVLQAGHDRRRNLRRQGIVGRRRIAVDSLLCVLPIAAIGAWFAWLASRLLR
jgi:hypothetical protein